MDIDKTASNLPTLKDIADAAEVSVASVSKVLNNRGGVGEESRRRILAIAEEVGYLGRTAKTLQRAGVDRAALIVPAEFYARSQFYQDVIGGFLGKAVTNSIKVDVRLVPLETKALLAEFDTILRDLQPGALVPVGIDDPVIMNRFAQTGLPTVLINGMDRTMRFSSVLPDNWSAGWLATQHLLNAGHRNLIYIGAPHRFTLMRRLEGFRIALEENGIVFDKSVHVIDLAEMGVSEEMAQSAIHQAIESGRLKNVTGIFCNTDVLALGVMQALEAHGYNVPRDYSIISLDDIPIAQHSRPPLTTIQIDRGELGHVGADLLMERIADPEATIRRINLGVKLIERSSVAQFRG